MRKALVALLVLFALFAQAAAEEEKPLASVAQSACSIVQSGDYYLVYCFAQVHNDTDQILCLDQGVFELLNGDELLAVQEIDQLWPYFLDPGQDGYFFDVVAFEPDEDGPVLPTVTGLQYNVEYMTIDPQFANIPLECEASFERVTGGYDVVCRLSNPTQADVYSPSVTFAMYMEGGALLYADGVTLQDVGIPAGGQTLARFHVDQAFAEQWENYGALPATVRAAASYREEMD